MIRGAADPLCRPLARVRRVGRPGQKKRAAPAWGESRGRDSGPALGGGVWFALSESLSAWGARIDYEARIQRQPMELQHMPHTYEQMYRAMSMNLDHFFHGLR